MEDISIIIPVYNGGKFLTDTLNHISQLEYLDICTFIDDASTDNTKDILSAWQPKLQGVYYIHRNGQKIGTIKKVLYLMGEAKTLPKYIVLTDADTYFYNHNSKEALHQAVVYMEKNNLVAVGLMDVPFRDGNLIQRLQYWEYLSDRAMHIFLSKKGKMRCIPGAGGIYKSEVLLEALKSHSLKHAGDDMETTALVQKLGYKVGYYNTDLEARTAVPHSFTKLVKQRIRWTVGAIETYIKERDFYATRLLQFNRHSLQIFYETLKLLTYIGWYWALYKHALFIALIGLLGTYGLALILALLNPESKGQRGRVMAWMIPTSLMIYLVDTIRLPVAYAQVIWNAVPRLEATTTWGNTLRYLSLQPEVAR